LKKTNLLRDDYETGAPVKLLWNGRLGEVVSFVRDTNNLTLYTLKMDDGSLLNTHSDNFAAADHPWHEQMNKWRADGRARGFSSIVIGMKDNAWKAFYCNDTEGYHRLTSGHPDVKFKFYWRID
jgi:hypothetical protein